MTRAATDGCPRSAPRSPTGDRGCSVWDVRNEFLYASAEAEGTSGKTRPLLLLEENEDVVLGAKRTAMAALAKELGVRVRNLREAPPAGAKAR